jgi:hypothetical protein
LATTALVVGAGMVLITATLGDCSAFGGRCPQEPPPLLEDDAFWLSATGAFVAAATPIFLWAPSRGRLLLAVGIGAAIALVVGAAVRSSVTT